MEMTDIRFYDGSIIENANVRCSKLQNIKKSSTIIPARGIDDSVP